MKCPIKGCSEDCEECDGKSTTWTDEKGKKQECVFVVVWRARKKGYTSSPYKPLVEKEAKPSTTTS